MNPFEQYKPPYNSVEDMYNTNHKRYRVWFILFITFLSIIMVTTIIAVVHLVYFKDGYIDGVRNILTDPSINAKQKLSTAKSYWTRSLTINVCYLVAIIGFLVWFIVNFAKCVKAKDYSKFSPTYIFIFPLIVFFIVIYFFFTFSAALFRSWNVALFITITNAVLIVITNIVAFSKIRGIVYEFNRLKAALNSPVQQFSDLINSVNGNVANNPYDASAYGYKVDDQNPINENQNLQSARSLDEIYYNDMLNKLDQDKLIDMAKKLNIFEPETLSRAALTAKIVDIFVAKGQENNPNTKLNKKASDDKKSSDDDKPIQ